MQKFEVMKNLKPHLHLLQNIFYKHCLSMEQLLILIIISEPASKPGVLKLLQKTYL